MKIGSAQTISARFCLTLLFGLVAQPPLPLLLALPRFIYHVCDGKSHWNYDFFRNNIFNRYDKGGKVYAPSNKLRSLTLPDLEPMTYASGWLWNHDKFVDIGNAIHTFSVGAARPSDLDQPAIAAYLQGKGELLSKVQKISNRLRQEQINTLGQDWLDTCHVGLVKSDQSKYF